MPGTKEDPVRLDHFQNIINVGWNVLDVGIIISEAQGAQVNLQVGQVQMRFPGQERWPPDPGDGFQVLNPYYGGWRFLDGGWFHHANFPYDTEASVRTDPPFKEFAGNPSNPFGTQMTTGPATPPNLGIPAELPDISDFFEKYYMWHCGFTPGVGGAVCTLINFKKLKADWIKGEGLDRGDDPTSTARIPMGGEPLKRVSIDWHINQFGYDGFRCFFKAFVGVNGEFTLDGKGLVEYVGDGVRLIVEESKFGQPFGLAAGSMRLEFTFSPPNARFFQLS